MPSLNDLRWGKQGACVYCSDNLKVIRRSGWLPSFNKGRWFAIHHWNRWEIVDSMLGEHCNIPTWWMPSDDAIMRLPLWIMDLEKHIRQCLEEIPDEWLRDQC